MTKPSAIFSELQIMENQSVIKTTIESESFPPQTLTIEKSQEVLPKTLSKESRTMESSNELECLIC